MTPKGKSDSNKTPNSKRQLQNLHDTKELNLTNSFLLYKFISMRLDFYAPRHLHLSWCKFIYRLYKYVRRCKLMTWRAARVMKVIWLICCKWIICWRLSESIRNLTKFDKWLYVTPNKVNSDQWTRENAFAIWCDSQSIIFMNFQFSFIFFSDLCVYDLVTCDVRELMTVCQSNSLNTVHNPIV
jgi:hypothetical protein